MRSIRSSFWLVAAIIGVLSLTACIPLPQARPHAIDMARTQFAHIQDYIDADAQKAPRGRFVEFVDATGFHVPWSFIGMSDEELLAVRWDGAPAVVDAHEDSTTGTVMVAQRSTAYTGGGWMGNSYEVAACWSFTVDLDKHSIEGLSDAECPEKISWMLNGVEEMLSLRDLGG